MPNRKILGIRTSPKEVRYALLEWHGDGSVDFVNYSGESKLQYPASYTTTADKLKWLKGELDRIFRQSPDIEQVVIKMNEFSGRENKPKRVSTYADAICILAASENNVPVSCRLYSQISSTSTDAKRDAENRVGRTKKYWDNRIADAVLAAHSVRRTLK